MISSAEGMLEVLWARVLGVDMICAIVHVSEDGFQPLLALLMETSVMGC